MSEIELGIAGWRIRALAEADESSWRRLKESADGLGIDAPIGLTEFRDAIVDSKQSSQPMHLIERRAGTQSWTPVGVVGLSNNRPGKYHLICALDPTARFRETREPISDLACLAFLAWARDVGFGPIVAFVTGTNSPSRRLVESLGGVSVDPEWSEGDEEREREFRLT